MKTFRALAVPDDYRYLFFVAGGALAVDYAVDAVLEETGPIPDRLILLSPAIGITAFGCLVLFFFPDPIYRLLRPLGF